MVGLCGSLHYACGFVALARALLMVLGYVWLAFAAFVVSAAFAALLSA
jgi:hypothetical protein